jgi:hypothetical protein
MLSAKCFFMKKIVIPCCALLCLLLGCSSGNKTGSSNESRPPVKPVAKQAEYETGRTAFQKLYVSARMWAADVKPFRLQSQFTGDAPTQEGKSGLWRASFASPSKRMMKLFVWSGLAGPDAPQPGISFSAEDSWNPSNTSTPTFDIGYLKVDGDSAYSVAQKHGGEKLTQKDAKQPVFFVLDWDASKSQLLWHVIYGNSQDESKLRIAVDATSGEFVRVEK